MMLALWVLHFFFLVLHFCHLIQKELNNIIVKFLSFTSTYLEEKSIKMKVRNRSSGLYSAHNYWIPTPPSL